MCVQWLSFSQTVYVNQNLHSILQRSYKLTAIEEMLHNKKHSVKPMSDLSEDEMSTLHHGLGIVRLLEPDFPYEKVDLIEDSENEVGVSQMNWVCHFEQIARMTCHYIQNDRFRWDVDQIAVDHE